MFLKILSSIQKLGFGYSEDIVSLQHSGNFEYISMILKMFIKGTI
jgi:hypothetical protein